MAKNAGTRAKGLHERLDEIHTEIISVNMETILDGPSCITAAARVKIRRTARRLLELCDEHELLDGLATQPPAVEKPE